LTSKTRFNRLGVDLQRGAVTGDSGVGDNDVDTAELFDALVGCGLHRGEITHVSDYGQHPVIAAQLGGLRRQCRLVQVGQNQLGALCVQPSGHLGPDAMSTTGDEYDLRVY
jgi:hypothetical protein